MKHLPFIFALVLFSLYLTACDSRSTGGDTPLIAAASSPAWMDNDERVGHYQQGHWDVASEHFRKAVKADPNSAIAYYNLGLTQNKMGEHDEATVSFKKAVELAPNDPVIKDSEIVKKHTGM
jgi:Flp pilus assembly protein TadD